LRETYTYGITVWGRAECVERGDAVPVSHVRRDCCIGVVGAGCAVRPDGCNFAPCSWAPPRVVRALNSESGRTRGPFAPRQIHLVRPAARGRNTGGGNRRPNSNVRLISVTRVAAIVIGMGPVPIGSVRSHASISVVRDTG